MAITNIFQILQIDEQSATPKYQQVGNAIINAIRTGNLPENYMLPSISDLSYELDIARDTAEKAYKHLKNIGVIYSVASKGFFVKKSNWDNAPNVLLMFNKLSQHKKIIYDSFIATLGDHISVDFYIYNNDYALFKKILTNKSEGYTHYVLITHFLEGNGNAYDLLVNLDKKKLILLDKLLPELEGNFGAVYEDFEQDIFNALEEALPQLAKYHTIKIIFPHYTYHPQEIVKGLRQFCQTYTFNYEVVHDVNKETIEKGTTYINLMEDDLVILLKKIRSTDLLVGSDIGIISYNETLMKQFILDGITTISTDFAQMGREAAMMILTNEQKMIKVPFRLNLRPSL